MKKTIMFAIAIMCCFTFAVSTNAAADVHKIGWSHYTGWEPWDYIQKSGILKKWADKYGVEIELQFFGDYGNSINAFITPDFSGCVMTNMDALIGPASAGIDSEILIIGDYSNGNDAIVLLNGKSVKDLKGRKVFMYTLTVSHYMLARALEMEGEGLRERDIFPEHTTDNVIASAFIGEAKNNPEAAVITWNPPLMDVLNVANATKVFDSSQIPFEILDCMIVKKDTPVGVKSALVGAWYEAMAIMEKPKSKAGKHAIAMMASSAECSVPVYKAQLKTTAMYYKAYEAVEFATGKKIQTTMDFVRRFCFDKGIMEGAATVDTIGIAFPDGTIMGDKNNVKLTINKDYAEKAAKGEL